MSSRLIVIVIYPLFSIQSSWSIFCVHFSSQFFPTQEPFECQRSLFRRSSMCETSQVSSAFTRLAIESSTLSNGTRTTKSSSGEHRKKVLFSKVERCSRSDDELNRVVYLSMKLDAVQSIYMKWNPLCKWITKYLATEDVSASLALTHTVLAFFLLFFSSMRSISNANMNSNLLLLRDLLRLQKARRMQPFFVLIPFFMCTRFSLVLPPL